MHWNIEFLNGTWKACLTLFLANAADAIVEIPGQPSRTCDAIQTSATLGDIPENECALVQGFVLDKCGCSAPEGIGDDESLTPSVTDPSATTLGSSAIKLREETILSALLAMWLFV